MMEGRKLFGARRRPVEEMVYILIGALALMLGTGAIYLNWQQAQRTSVAAARTRQHVGSIRRLLTQLYRAETGQRGYLLTENSSYATGYRDAVKQMPEILERLHRLSEDQPAVSASVKEVNRLARAKMGEVQTAVELVEQGSTAAAELLVRSNFGKQTMDQLVVQLDALEERVYAYEEEFNRELQERMRRTAALTVICCIALFALFAIENHRVASRKRAAEKSSEVKSAFLANMSHELRTPLNAIIGYSQMLQEEAGDEEREGDLRDLQRIEAAGKHLLELINGVLELSKIEAGRLEANPTSFEVEELMREVTAMIEPLAMRNGNRLTVAIAPNVGRMFSDATRIKQGLVNLASNAAKFTKNGEVNIRIERTERDGPWVDFAVQDTGPGIAQRDIEQLFEPFMQVSVRGGGARQEGTGLGLALTRRFCRLLGGDVRVESVVGQGSTFTMQLPAEYAEAGMLGEADGMSPAVPSKL